MSNRVLFKCTDKGARRGSLTVLALLAVLTAQAHVPLGLPDEKSPEVSPENHALEELGRRLFADKRLSVDGSVSCATCHIPERRFTDGQPTAHGLRGRSLTRHTPSLLNVRYARSLFWDGRALDLATQVRTPLLGPAEHGLIDEQAVAKFLRSDVGYAQAFERVLGIRRANLSIVHLGTALAAYERTLLSGDSAFDRYMYGHDATAMTPAALRGLALFRGRAQCESCHRIGQNSALLTDQDFHPSPLPLPDQAVSQLGELAERVAELRRRGETDALNALVASDQNIAALGRFVVTLDPKDIGCFKTPSLRNVALLGPYMHNGSVPTLSEAIEVELYSRTGRNYPLVLTEDERTDLLHFLEALSSH